MRHNNPPHAITTGMVKHQIGLLDHKNLLTKQSFLAVEGHNVILSTVKKAEQGEDLILRLYNPSDNTTQASIHLPFAPRNAELVGLDELPRAATTGQTIPVLEEDGKVKISLAPKKIITLRIERA